MSVKVTLEWSFSPPDYFEDSINIYRLNYNMSIADGKVVAELNSVIYEADPLMHKELHDDLIGRFRGAQLLTHRAYKLSNLTIAHVHPSGRRDIVVELGSQCLTLFMGSLDSQLTNKDESIVSDSKKDRIEKIKNLAELVATHHADTVLTALLKSYDSAVRDPNNELVHLYEIRDALSTRFGNDKTTKAKLSITNSQWSSFGLLCNIEPLRQGRHRGNATGALRDATESELFEARGIALAMIEGYLQYLEAINK